MIVFLIYSSYLTSSLPCSDQKNFICSKTPLKNTRASHFQFTVHCLRTQFDCACLCCQFAWQGQRLHHPRSCQGPTVVIPENLCTACLPLQGPKVVIPTLRVAAFPALRRLLACGPAGGEPECCWLFLLQQLLLFLLLLLLH